MFELHDVKRVKKKRGEKFMNDCMETDSESEWN